MNCNYKKEYDIIREEMKIIESLHSFTYIWTYVKKTISDALNFIYSSFFNAFIFNMANSYFLSLFARIRHVYTQISRYIYTLSNMHYNIYIYTSVIHFPTRMQLMIRYAFNLKNNISILEILRCFVSVLIVPFLSFYNALFNSFFYAMQNYSMQQIYTKHRNDIYYIPYT